MVVKYRNLMIVLYAAAIICITTGCSVVNALTLSEGIAIESSTPTAIATKQANTILESVILKDDKALKSLFTPKLQEGTELDEQINSFFDFIDGTIVSYSEPQGTKGRTEVRDGKIVKQKLNGYIYNIKTDTGKTYEIQHHSIKINEKDADEIGVYCISIFDVDLYNAENDYPDSGKLVIGNIEKD